MKIIATSLLILTICLFNLCPGQENYTFLNGHDWTVFNENYCSKTHMYNAKFRILQVINETDSFIRDGKIAYMEIQQYLTCAAFVDFFYRIEQNRNVPVYYVFKVAQAAIIEKNPQKAEDYRNLIREQYKEARF